MRGPGAITRAQAALLDDGHLHDHDLATVALDLLVAETGKTPSGVNFMLIHGDPGPE